MKKLFLASALLISATMLADTSIVHFYTQTRDLSQVALVLNAQPHLANQVTTDGVTPLHELAGHTSFSAVFGPGEAAGLVKVLLHYDANPSAVDSDGNTPLHLAARAASVAVANLLHEAGASSHAVNKAGETPKDIVNKQLGRATPARVGIDTDFQQVAQGLLRITTPTMPLEQLRITSPSPGPKANG